MDVQKLSKRLNESCKVQIDAEDYIRGIDLVFEGSLAEKLEQGQILIRAFQDHSKSRQYLTEKVRGDIRKSLRVFQECDNSAISVLVDCFSNQSESEALVLEIKQGLQDKTLNSVFLFTVVLQLLNKYHYSFEVLKFLVKEIILRCDEAEIRPLMLVIFAQLDKGYKSEFEKYLLDIIDSLLIEADAEATESSLLIVVGLLTQLYPASTALCTNVFLGQEFQDVSKRKLFKSDENLAFNLLTLLSVACVDETVRCYIADNYIDALGEGVKTEKFKVHSALVLIKTWSFSKLKGITVDSLGRILIDALGVSDQYNEIAVEGLAYLTLKPSVKAMLIRNNDALLDLISMLKSSKTAPILSYGILVVIANLSSKLEDQNSAEHSVHGLKAYADMKRLDQEEAEGADAALSNEDIVAFNRDVVVELNVLGVSKAKLSSQSSGFRLQLIRIIYNLASNKELVAESVKQGSVTLLLDALSSATTPDNFKNLALRSLARTLVMINPDLVFLRYSALNVLPFLFDLIPDPEAPSTGVEVATRDSYEALLALTNLATLQDKSVCEKIISTPSYWAKIENLMLDTAVEIQRSTLELLCNLMAGSLHLAAKFFNFENPRSVRNFNILAKLLNLEDLKSQLAVSAIFANVSSSVPFIAQELAFKSELIDNAIEVLQKQCSETELRHRLIIFFDALASSSPEVRRSLSHIPTLRSALTAARAYEAKQPSDYLEALDSILSDR
ncbi:LAQU0S10e01332g1_1 [Lachancea quebecensis]|uniref:LAQU0S10e01332g1_1 n=1 Tax=Lachancea quebecensis TaxID=1654605 RepID=A0A0P1KU93_9SACH|nr:LAQU0S10e01332g1_1 [Lachancea quebecensis]